MQIAGSPSKSPVAAVNPSGFMDVFRSKYMRSPDNPAKALIDNIKAMHTRVSLVTNDQGFCRATFLPPGLYLIVVNVYVYLSVVSALT